MTGNASPVILVTGAGRRIGTQIAQCLHAAGACIAVHANTSLDGAQTLADRLNIARPNSALVLQADLLAPTAAHLLVGAVIEKLGRLDGLVNNASCFFPTPIGQIDDAVGGAWDQLVGSNFKAPLMLAQAAAPYLRKAHGAIVNITDVHAERPLAGYPLYSAAKGALLTLTRALAIELAPEVRVNAVAPGPILWPEDGQFPAQDRQSIIDHTLLKRAGNPSEIAQAVQFLLMQATYVTGQVLNVDGGRTAHL